MKENKFIIFLVFALGFSALLAGYILVSRGMGNGPEKQTGTILDKFEEEQTTKIIQQPKEKAKPFLISNKEIVSLAAMADENGIMYFDKNTGKLYEYDFSSRTEKVRSETPLPNFIKAVWSSTKDKVISEFYDSTGNFLKHHDYFNHQTTDLNKNISHAAFSPDGGLIAYYHSEQVSPQVANDEEEFNESAETPDPTTINTTDDSPKIFISQPDGSYPKKILNTRLKLSDLQWPNKDKIALKTKGSEIFLLTPEGQLTKFIESSPYLEGLWSRSGRKLLFSAIPKTGEWTLSLYAKDVDSNQVSDLGISVSAIKCVWSIDNENIFCAISKSPSVDEIYLINTINRRQKLIAEPNTVIERLYLSKIEDHLLFNDASDGKLYGLEINKF